MINRIVSNRTDARIRVFAWSLAALLTLTAIYLHIVRLVSAGPLWRDELNTLHIARLPWGELWRSLDYDSFPLAGPLLIRVWSTLGLAESTTTLRGFGFIVGLAVLGTLWLHAWRQKCGPPLISVALFGLSVVTIRFGDAIRSYGLGMLLIMLTYVAIADVLERRTPLRVFCAALAAILSVQCLYQNSILLLALGLAGATVAWWRGERSTALTVLGIGAVAAVSLLPYVGPLKRAREWSELLSQGATTYDIGVHLERALSRPNGFVLIVWEILALLTTVATLIYVARYFLSQSTRKTKPRLSKRERRATRKRQENAEPTPSPRRTHDPAYAIQREIRPFAVPYSTIAVLLAWLLTIAFFRSAELGPKPWYFLSLLGLTALWFDTVLVSPLNIGPWSLVVRSLVAIGISCVTLWGAATNLKKSPTNAPQVAALVSEEASADDLVVVLPWHFGISWERYYTGSAPWMTAPPISDLTIHRYDLLKKKIDSGASLDVPYEQIERTLKAGHNVWIVGFVWPSNLAPPESVTAEDTSEFNVNEHLLRWALDMGRFVERHTQESETPIKIPPNFKPPDYEYLRLWRFKGWQDKPPQKAS